MLFQSDAEIIYPTRVTPLLRSLRGQVWQKLIDEVTSCPSGSIEHQAFTLMMIRLDGCLTCHADSYRAMRGCTLCAQQTITRFKGGDEELVAIYEQAKRDMIHYYQTGEVPLNERLPED